MSDFTFEEIQELQRHDQGASATWVEVLAHFYPGCAYTLEGEDYSTLTWETTSIDKPSEDRLNALKTELDYVRVRRAAYPSLEEQLDALYHDIDNSDTLKAQFPTFHRAIKDVKLSIAKSTETINKYTDSNDTDYTSLY